MEKIIRAFLPGGKVETLAPLGEGIINTTFSVIFIENIYLLLQSGRKPQKFNLQIYTF